jgi:hypothetical protein
MVDLLGRNTAAAKIFQEKFGEEFGHSRVVVFAQKCAALVLLLSLNAFFVYFILLKAFQKGYGWQLQYLVCTLVQFAVELLIFETVECAWLNFWVPEFVLQDVAIAAATLKRQVEQVTADVDVAKGRSHAGSGYFLNAPAALFVSTKLAKAYPQLLESMIVCSYTNHLPGPLSGTWRHKSQAVVDAHGVSGAVRRVTAGMTLALSIFITMPFTYQRIVIRFVQPMIFSGVSIVWFAAFRSPASIAAMAAVTASLVGYLQWKRYQARQAAEQVDCDHAAVGHTVAIDIAPVPTFVQFDDCSDTEDDSMRNACLNSDWDSSFLSDETTSSNRDVDISGGSGDLEPLLGSSRSSQWTSASSGSYGLSTLQSDHDSCLESASHRSSESELAPRKESSRSTVYSFRSGTDGDGACGNADGTDNGSARSDLANSVTDESNDSESDSRDME